MKNIQRRYRLNDFCLDLAGIAFGLLLEALILNAIFSPPWQRLGRFRGDAGSVIVFVVGIVPFCIFTAWKYNRQ
ncbi:MAG: hypothetical protein LBQ62_07895 [Candidatus Accumulibacter sp.]|nr:hypothetical protein [Accumulibacter sp.]